MRIPTVLRSIPLGLSLLFAACPNPTSDCEEICDWYIGFCDEDYATCLDDCAWADSYDFGQAKTCPGTTPSSCRAASCCIRFAYDEVNFERECL